ncbi:MAG TPA: FGGY-family carbohydrate kinase [Acidimicrobiales bacterium]
MTVVSGSITVGIDIGTTAVKAVAADETGAVLARARIPHRLLTPAPDQLEHDAGQAWRRGPMRALAQVTAGGADVAGVCVTSMVPSLAAVDRRGIPRSPGLLYGDVRGQVVAGPDVGDTDSVMPDAGGFVRWAVREVPGARGYWPAQAVANYALGRVPAIDTGTAICMGSMRTGNHWNDDVLTTFGVTQEQLPVVVPMGQAAGTLTGSDTVLAAGTVDALCDQIVSGADHSGDVLVIFGATLIVWAVVDDWIEAPGLWTLPHTVAGKVLVGGPSNAGALFLDWARALLHGTAPRPPRPAAASAPAAAGTAAEPERRGDPGRVPVWTPYLRGERAPYHDTSLRAGLHDLDLTHDAGAVERAAYEASGFVIRHMLDRAGITARRIVASGGGTHVVPWMQGVADACGLPVDTVGVAEGSALGAAYIARWTAGLESSLDGAQRWARVGRRVEPEARWAAAASKRYARFLALSPGT